MSLIDKHWNDRLVYYIGFTAEIMKIDGTKEDKEFHRTFVFPQGLTVKEIEGLIFSKLDNIREIMYIDEFVEALELREDTLFKQQLEF